MVSAEDGREFCGKTRIYFTKYPEVIFGIKGGFGRRTEDNPPDKMEGPNADRTSDHAPYTRRILVEVSKDLSEPVIAAWLALGKAVSERI